VGLAIVLQDERGTRIESVDDPKNVLHRLLPQPDDTTSRCLRYIDWYGDTVFNRRQAGDLLEELQLLPEKAHGEEEKELLNQIIELARRCAREPHLYLKFSGD
jgi:hypothetical protein